MDNNPRNWNQTALLVIDMQVKTLISSSVYLYMYACVYLLYFITHKKLIKKF